jgi:hypothetical protein
MYVRCILYLKRSEDGTYPGPEVIQAQFRALGLDVMSRNIEMGKYETEKVDPIGKEVDICSTLRYRDQANKNVLNETPQSIAQSHPSEVTQMCTA